MFQESYMRKIAAVVGLAAIVALASYTYFTITQAQYMREMPVTISVTGEGEVFATPDVASFSFSVTAQEKEVADAQKRSADSINAIMSYLKEQGIEDKDIKTEYYNLNPRYEYPRSVCTEWSCPPVGEPTLIGYEVTQSIFVKVRETDKAGTLIAGVGELGATNVSGLSFTIDDEDALKAEAREAAIADAKAKAETLAKNLGVRIVRMNSFWEEQGGMPYYGYGIGGMEKAMSADVAAAPAALPMGENTITSRVNISYEIR